MRHPDFASSNRRALLLMILGLVLVLILMSLPLYRFNISVYTKKSPNTFVGDEKYLAVLAEVEETAQKYREQGFDVQIGEDVVERVNSKGEKTSLITFTINESFGKSMLGYLGSGLSSAAVAAAILLLMAFALIAVILGCRGSMDLMHRYLDRRSARLRSAAAVALLLALLLVPVFILMNNYAFNREIGLYNAERLVEGKDAFFAKMDRFLFDGQMGEGIGKALGGSRPGTPASSGC